MPERRIQYETIPGRSGTLSIDDGSYNDVTITIECGFESNEYMDKVNEIKAWLMGPEDKLILNDEEDKYYFAQVVNKFDIAQSIKTFGEFPLVFNCKPFKQRISDDTITLTSPGIVYNIGTVASRPVIKIYGSGNITLTINSQTIAITEINEYVTIDSVLQDCYKDSALWNSHMTGEFPTLTVGDNSISWTGTISKVEIIPNWGWI